MVCLRIYRGEMDLRTYVWGSACYAKPSKVKSTGLSTHHCSRTIVYEYGLSDIISLWIPMNLGWRSRFLVKIIPSLFSEWQRNFDPMPPRTPQSMIAPRDVAVP